VINTCVLFFKNNKKGPAGLEAEQLFCEQKFKVFYSIFSKANSTLELIHTFLFGSAFAEWVLARHKKIVKNKS